MKPTQAVTIVSSGGTPIQLADQRGAPYPTTGYGALVFNTGPYLIDAHLTGTLTNLDSLKVAGGTFYNPSLQFTLGDSKTPGMYSTGPGNLSLVGTNGVELSRALLGSFDWPGSLAIPQFVTVGGVLPANESSNKVATTSWVKSLIGGGGSLAPIDSPIFTGDPQVPTPPPGDDDHTIPNTEWVNDAIDAAIDSLPPPITDWDDIPGKPATFPPTIPSTPDTIDDWPFLPLTGGTLSGALYGTTATFSTVSAGGSGAGTAFASTGGAANPGYFALFRPNGDRLGYIGFNDNKMSYNADAGYFHEFTTGAVSILGNLTGTTATFSGDVYATAAGTPIVDATHAGVRLWKDGYLDISGGVFWGGMSITQTTAPVDQRRWLFRTLASGGYTFAATTDNGTAQQTWSFFRDGTTVLPGPLTGTTATFSGEVKALTVAYPDNDTTVATTAYVTTATSNFQPLDSDLTALAALTTTGIMVRAAQDVYPTRTITGTANRIAITNGGGISGNPTIDISAGYDAALANIYFPIHGGTLTAPGNLTMPGKFTINVGGSSSVPKMLGTDNSSNIASTAWVRDLFATRGQGDAVYVYAGNTVVPTTDPGNGNFRVENAVTPPVLGTECSFSISCTDADSVARYLMLFQPGDSLIVTNEFTPVDAYARYDLDSYPVAHPDAGSPATAVWVTFTAHFIDSKGIITPIVGTRVKITGYLNTATGDGPILGVAAGYGLTGGGVAGNVELDVDATVIAPLDSPVFTGNPTAPTPLVADNDTSIATTKFVKDQGYVTLVDADDRFVNVTGDTMTGSLIGTSATFSGDITSGLTVTAPNLHATTYLYRTGTDGNPIALFSGATKGVRIGTDAFGSSIEGVDNTGTGSYQPLIIGGSTVNVIAPLTGTSANFSDDVSFGAGSRKATFDLTGGNFQSLNLNYSDNLFAFPLRLQNLGLSGFNQGAAMSAQFGNDGITGINAGVVGFLSAGAWPTDKSSKYVMYLTDAAGGISTAMSMTFVDGFTVGAMNVKGTSVTLTAPLTGTSATFSGNLHTNAMLSASGGIANGFAHAGWTYSTQNMGGGALPTHTNGLATAWNHSPNGGARQSYVNGWPSGGHYFQAFNADRTALVDADVWAGTLTLSSTFNATSAVFSGTLKAGKTGLNGANPDATAGLTFGTTLGGNGLNGVYVYDDGTGISGMGITANTLNVYSGGNQVKIGVSAVKTGAGSMTDVALFLPDAMQVNGQGYFVRDTNGIHTGIEIRNTNAGDNATARLLFNLAGTPNGYALIEASNFGTSPGVMSYFAGPGFVQGHVFNKAMTVFTDADADVRGALRIAGTGQDSNNPTTATAQQATINIESTNVNPGTGGMIKFSMAGGSGYAAIKGQGVNGGGNTQGGIGFSTRRVDTDATLTEAMRIEYQGNVVMNADAYVLGNFQVNNSATTLGSLRAGIPPNGGVSLNEGGTANTGYVAFFDPAGTRRAYIGYGATGQGIIYALDSGTYHQFEGAVKVNNQLQANLMAINRDGLATVSLAITGTSTGPNWLHYCVDSADQFKFGVQDSGIVFAKGLDVDGITFGNALTAKFSTVDGGISGLFRGQSKGVRFIHYSSGSTIEGVDNTGGISYQPLTLGGSEVNAPTPPAADNSTKIATTAWVRTNLSTSGGTGDVSAIQTGSFTNPYPSAVLIFTQIASGNSGGWLNTTNGRYTPPAGRYHIYASMSGYNNAATIFTLTLRKNGTNLINDSATTSAGGTYADVDVSGTFDANGTDYFDVVGASSTSNQNAFVSQTFTAYPIGGIKGPQGDPGVAGGGGDIPVGGIVDFAGAVAPAGWLLCQGQAVSRTSYANLYAALGGASSPWGQGNGSTTFNVPDLGGRVTAGKETAGSRLTTAGAGIDGGVLAAAGGAQTHTLSAAQAPSHNHVITTGSHAHAVNPGYSTMLANAGNIWDFTVVAGTTGASGYTGYTSASTDTAGNLGGSTDIRGSDTAHQNTQPTIVMNKIIKT